MAPAQAVAFGKPIKPKAAASGQQGNAQQGNPYERGNFVLGIIQATIGFLGLIGLFFTVLYARRAWQEAQTAAKAATDSLKHTQRVADAELRPWVRVDVTIQSVEITIAYVVFRYEIVFENLGDTVARDLDMRWHFFHDDKEYAANIDGTRKVWWERKNANEGVLMPGDRTTIPCRYQLAHRMVPWKDHGSGLCFSPLIDVAAFYTSDVDGQWKRTFRTFSPTGQPDKLGIVAIKKNIGTLYPPDVLIKTYGAALAT